MHARLIFYALGALAVAALFALGFLGLSTHVFTALGVGLLVVGVSQLFTARDATVPLLLIGGGVLVWLGPSLIPDLTVGALASFVGVGA